MSRFLIFSDNYQNLFTHKVIVVLNKLCTLRGNSNLPWCIGLNVTKALSFN